MALGAMALFCGSLAPQFVTLFVIPSHTASGALSTVKLERHPQPQTYVRPAVQTMLDPLPWLPSSLPPTDTNTRILRSASIGIRWPPLVRAAYPLFGCLVTVLGLLLCQVRRRRTRTLALMSCSFGPGPLGGGTCGALYMVTPPGVAVRALGRTISQLSAAPDPTHSAPTTPAPRTYRDGVLAARRALRALSERLADTAAQTPKPVRLVVELPVPVNSVNDPIVPEEGGFPGGIRQRFRALRPLVEDLIEGYRAEYYGQVRPLT